VQRIVLKRYPAGGRGVTDEWKRLQFARTIDVPTPEPVAVDEAGDWFGTPALVISRLPGRAALQPPRSDDWMREIARALVALSCADLLRARRELPAQAKHWTWTPPDTTGWGKVYERAVERAQALLKKRSRARVVCHADFHPGNMLFERDKLSGIVDWSEMKIGGPSRDLSYCRTELSLLFGVEAAERLRSAYTEVSGIAPVDVPLWDLLCALSARRWSHTWLAPYGEQGRRDLTLRQFRARLAAFTARALEESS
jgi:aminoglycoside phosphotransferase (APT) family kinase protein